MIKKISKIGRQKIWNIHRDYLIEKSEFRYLFWECTLMCNLKCKHCGSSAGKISPDELNTEEIKESFLDISKNFNAKDIMVAVTGGEPLLRKDLFDVMKYANSLGFRWGMVSNGLLMNKDNVEKIKNANMSSIEISIDGIGEIHDEFRGVDGSYEKAIEGVKLLKEYDFLKNLGITTTIHDKNIDYLYDMYQEFSKLGIDSWRLLSVDPIGRALEEGISLSNNNLKKLLRFVKEKRKKEKNFKITFGCSHFLGEYFEDEVRNFFFFCKAGINIGSILNNGDIFVCPNVPRHKELIQGNIRNEKFSDVWNNKFKFYRDKNRSSCDKCRKCEYWNDCRGGSLHTWDFKNKKQDVCFMKDDN